MGDECQYNPDGTLEPDQDISARDLWASLERCSDEDIGSGAAVRTMMDEREEA